ncbi:MAG: hypothetical protein IJ955_01640 [Oscillospiraceae bacterium]|nr:hypothetical protein [Oscillospiraceae bacterium]
MKKRFLQAFLTLALLYSLLPTTAQAAEHTSHALCTTAGCTSNTHDHTTIDAWTAWDGSTTELSGGSYYLTEDITTNSTIVITGAVNLCLSGHKLALAEGQTGGVIRVLNGATLNLCDCNGGDSNGDAPNFTVPDPTKTDGSTIAIHGGLITRGFVSNEGTFTMYGGSVSGNTTSGVSNGGTFTMYGGSVSGNTTSGVSNGGTFIMYGGSISANSAEEQGGGVANRGFGTFTMYGGSIVGNRANYNGGGVYNNTRFTMYGGSITGNSANYGSGVYNDGTVFTMQGGFISANSAEEQGGGVYNSGIVTMDGGTIASNHANKGGGVFNEFYGTLTMNGGTIAENSTSQDGGGVYNYYGTFTMYGGSISKNYAANGGGIYNECTTFTMQDGSICENTAASSGGGIYNTGSLYSRSTVTMIDGCMVENTAVQSGGGVYNAHYCTFTMQDGSITGNGANKGGGVFNNYTFTMQNGSISENTATSNGGGVHNYGTLNLSGNITITDNTTDSNANNLYLCTNNFVTVNGTLSSTANIGVTMETVGIFAQPDGTNVTSLAAYAKYFTSDNGDYAVVAEGNNLALRKLVEVSSVGQGKVKVSLAVPMENVVIYAAGYTDGRMVDCKTQAADRTEISLTVSGESIRVFFLDKNTLAPVFQAFHF